MATKKKTKTTRGKRDFASKYKDKFVAGITIKTSQSYIPHGISTQSICLDMAIGRPGIPGGRITQSYGLDGCGKSTLMGHLLAEVQQMGGQAVLADTESCYDFERLEKQGVNLANLHILDPDNLEELLDMIPEYTEDFFSDKSVKGTPLLIVVDSLEGVVPKDIQEAEADKRFVSQAPRIMGTHLPRIYRQTCKRHKATLALVSQQYDKIGGNTFFGPEYEVKGGKAVKYRASLRLEIKARQTKTNQIFGPNDESIGFKNEVKVWKNKSASPFASGDYFLTFEDGIDKYSDLYEAALEMDVITVKSAQGGWYNFDLGKKSIPFQKSKWSEVVDEQLKGPVKLKDRLQKRAIKQGYMRPYGCYAPETDNDTDES